MIWLKCYDVSIHSVEEWDVCNEELHQHFFEDLTKYRDILITEFKKAHMVDPKALLFLNDYQITRDGQLTSVSSHDTAT